MNEERAVLRMNELVKATGVSSQTIHYYLREGLLLPPTKTAPNMSYYGPEFVEDIRLIKELQEKRYLPLSVIKLVLDAKREGKDVSELRDMRLSLEAIFRPLGREELVEPVTLAELVAMTGLAAETIEALEDMGLLMPADTIHGLRYDDLDVRLARALKKLLSLGLEPADLFFYVQYVETLRTEARVIKEKIFKTPVGVSGVTGSEIRETLDSLKATLTAKVYRQEAANIQRRDGAGDVPKNKIR